MNKRLERLIAELQQTTTLESLQKTILGLRDQLGTEHIVYHSVNSTGQQYAALTYTDKWVKHYLQEDFARLDPVVQGCFRRFNPVDWKDLDWTGKPVRSFLAEAFDAGVGNQGFSVPIRGPNGQFALFTINHHCTDGEWERYTESHTRDVILIAHYINQKALEIERGTDFLPARNLSPREVDALSLLAMGLNRAQAADSLSISEHTFRVYLESARTKLGAANTTHAVARAVARGLLVV